MDYSDDVVDQNEAILINQLNSFQDYYCSDENSPNFIQDLLPVAAESLAFSRLSRLLVRGTSEFRLNDQHLSGLIDSCLAATIRLEDISLTQHYLTGFIAIIEA